MPPRAVIAGLMGHRPELCLRRLGHLLRPSTSVRPAKLAAAGGSSCLDPMVPAGFMSLAVDPSGGPSACGSRCSTTASRHRSRLARLASAGHARLPFRHRLLPPVFGWRTEQISTLTNCHHSMIDQQLSV